MSLIPDTVVFQKRLATLPLATYQAGETVFAAGSRTGRLLILRKGAVAIVKEAIEIAKVAELAQDPIALLYVAVVLARRLDGANQALIELKSQVQAGQPPSVIGKTVKKMEGLLGDSGASLYAGDPYDSYA